MLQETMTQARLQQAAVEHAMAALHHGAALLLAEVPHDQAATVQALLDQGAQHSVEGGR